MIDLRQSPFYARFMSRTGWQVIRHQNNNVFIKKLGLLGSIIKIQRHSWPLDLSQVDQLAHLHHAFMVKLEPNIILDNLETSKPRNFETILSSHGFRLDSWPLIPPKTQVINLTHSLSQITSQFHSGATRNIKLAQKNNLIITVGDWQTFYSHWQPTARKRGLVIPNFQEFKIFVESFGKNILILNCYQQLETRNSKLETNPWLGGLVIPIANRTAYYYFATATPQGKHLRAPYLLTLEALKLAKNLNCKTFDFDGIADPRFKATNNKDWRGFSEFKAKFGGEPITYIGSFTKYYGPGRIIGVLDRILSK